MVPPYNNTYINEIADHLLLLKQLINLYKKYFKISQQIIVKYVFLFPRQVRRISSDVAPQAQSNRRTGHSALYPKSSFPKISRGNTDFLKRPTVLAIEAWGGFSDKGFTNIWLKKIEPFPWSALNFLHFSVRIRAHPLTGNSW
jgi:hypothetical protein